MKRGTVLCSARTGEMPKTENGKKQLHRREKGRETERV
jgi:hypothetical protein